jgi:hypothetical protein
MHHFSYVGGVLHAEGVSLARIAETVGTPFYCYSTATLERQLADTEQLVARTTADFQQRHGTAMPDDNVWLAQRRAEQAALTQLLSIMDSKPGRAVQGGGCGAAANRAKGDLADDHIYRDRLRLLLLRGHRGVRALEYRQAPG